LIEEAGMLYFKNISITYELVGVLNCNCKLLIYLINILEQVMFISKHQKWIIHIPI